MRACSTATRSDKTVRLALVCVLIVVGVAPQIAYSAPSRKEFLRKLVAAATERTHHSVRYVSAYVRIPYPGGDVPADTGVCTDEIIRSYRAVGIDLQKEVHEDMVQNFEAYPNQRRWRLAHPDSNIDHRRVPNLMVFFQRKGETLPITKSGEDYSPGDLVTWDLGGACRISVSSSTRRLGGAATSWLYTTSARDRRWKMCFSTGRSQDTIATSG